MPNAFFRTDTDRVRTPVALENLYAGDPRSTCWILGGGPSLASLPIDRIAASPAPTFAINLAAQGLLRPTFWTAYDATARFDRSLYHDAGTLKFVPANRAMDLVPETTHKLCDAPGTVCFETEPGRTYGDWLDADRTRLVDWADSLVQAIAIAVRLGFRRLLLAGCEMRIDPPRALLALARRHGIDHDRSRPLSALVDACRAAGLTDETLDRLPRAKAYHFDEDKPLAATVRTDGHYFRVAQSLRLSRRTLGDRGVEIVLATPGSRLHPAFPYRDVGTLLAELTHDYGDRSRESPRGRYALTKPRLPSDIGHMVDMPPFVRGPQLEAIAV